MHSVIVITNNHRRITTNKGTFVKMLFVVFKNILQQLVTRQYTKTIKRVILYVPDVCHTTIHIQRKRSHRCQ